MRTALLWAALLVPTANGTAQFDNPEQKIQELTEQIATDLQEIDKLLLQTGSKGGSGEAASEAMKRSAEKMDELLNQTKESQGTAVKRIDELIQTLQQLQGNSSSDGQGEKPEGQPKQGQPQQSGQREQSRTPDMVQRPDPQGQQPKDGQENRNRGANKPAENQRNDATERVDHERNAGKWGKLPEYMEFLKTRGGQPEVPERYRRFRDAFLKQSQKTTEGGR